MAKQKLSICQVEDMTQIFDIFSNKLIQFITQAVFKCTPRNTHGFSCNLRKLDISRLENFCNSQESDFIESFSRPDDILEGIRNSTIHTFGHKIEIFADLFISADYVGPNGGLDILSNIFEENLKANFGISVYFKTISAQYISVPLPSDFYNVLALGRCEYIQLYDFDIDINLSENLCSHLPELVGLRLLDPNSFRSLDFLGELKYLEQLCLDCDTSHNTMLANSISNMSKGLKYLELSECSLHYTDFDCLANSIHSDTLLELKLSCSHIVKDSDAVGLIMLCNKLNKVKVITIFGCSLDTLSSNSVSNLVKAFKNCAQLEFLSLWANPFSLEITNIIIKGLADKKTLRYLSLDLPKANDDDDDEDIFEPNNLCKSFHETINMFRSSPLYISWWL